jgi:hypothetical protein
MRVPTAMRRQPDEYAAGALRGTRDRLLRVRLTEQEAEQVTSRAKARKLSLTALRRRGIEPIIPSRSNRIRTTTFDKARYRERNVIERCINRLKQWRRVATRYEKLAANYVAVILIAASVHFVDLLL